MDIAPIAYAALTLLLTGGILIAARAADRPVSRAMETERDE